MMDTKEELERAADAVEKWLDALDLDDPDMVDVDGENLRRVSALAVSRAPEPELAGAVRTARESGWGWSPIAMLLGMDRKAAVARFA